MSRAERAAVAVRLRADGLTAREIAERLGVSRSYAAALYADPDGGQDRARKRSYGGVCESCGARTDGSNGPDVAPTRCHRCTVVPARECVNCGRPAKPTRFGRCGACWAFHRRHGRDWTERDSTRGPTRRVAAVIPSMKLPA